jgi:hypothetical protein
MLNAEAVLAAVSGTAAVAVPATTEKAIAAQGISDDMRCILRLPQIFVKTDEES